jgi:hypothetical protein
LSRTSSRRGVRAVEYASGNNARPAHDGDEDNQPRRSRAGKFLAHPLAIAAVTALIAGWLVPAFAHQWQDRRDERELKREIATELDRGATRTVIASQLLIARLFPEAQTSDVRREEYRRARGADRAASLVAYREARERERVTGTESVVRTLSDWLVTRSVTRSKLTAHFPGQGLDVDWKELADSVQDFLTLASTRAGEYRADVVRRLKTYLVPEFGVGATWHRLREPPRPRGREQSRTYAAAVFDLSNALLLAKKTVVEDVLRAHAEGFSTRRRDLLQDLFPFI